MENSKKSSNTIWIVVGVIVVVLILWVAIKKHSADDAAQQPEVKTPDTVQATEDTTVGSVHATTSSKPGSITESYEDALVTYKDKRIQINDQCQANPNTQMTFKNNTNIMIDNRSSIAHTVKVGSPVPVKGYGFKIVNLSSAKLPATWLVDCDSQQNIATILIQK